ncbi:MAG: hypothetical protein KKE24_08580 [Candidatus Thermoplasmatota archaeon]|nr:hypothetical protein [Candidatus Thermoplasmatota archaeon]
MSERSQTQISIIDVNYYRDTNDLEVLVQNTGSIALEISESNLLVSGLFMSSFITDIEGKTTDIWLPLEVLTITVNDPLIDFDSDVGLRNLVANDAQLSSPTSLSVGECAYVLDGNSIDVFTLTGTFSFTITDSAHMVAPSDIKVFGEYLYVLDEASHIDRFDTDGNWVDVFVSDATNASTPVSFAIDSDYIYMIDNFDHIDRFNISTGVFVDQLIANGGTMTSPIDITVGAYIFVLDNSSGSNHIDRYGLDGSEGAQIIGSGMLSSTTDISVSAGGLDERSLFITNNSDEILVAYENGTMRGTIDEGLSDSVWGVDATGKIFVSDSVNGLVIERLGTSVKVVVENGISDIIML